MISILLPTRGRPLGLREAVSSCVKLAVKPESLEFLLRSDDDEPPMIDFIEPVLGPALANELRGPRGAGYREVYKHFNDLAAISHGDWIINFNDDAVIVTPGWDELLYQAPQHSVQFLRRDILPTADTTFPCTGRSVYQAMGHLSLQVHADDWMGRVAEEAGVALKRDDVVLQHSRLIDQTSWDRDHGGYDVAGFNAPEMVVLRSAAAERIKAADPRKALR